MVTCDPACFIIRLAYFITMFQSAQLLQPYVTLACEPLLEVLATAGSATPCSELKPDPDSAGPGPLAHPVVDHGSHPSPPVDGLGPGGEESSGGEGEVAIGSSQTTPSERLHSSVGGRDANDHYVVVLRVQQLAALVVAAADGALPGPTCSRAAHQLMNPVDIPSAGPAVATLPSCAACPRLASPEPCSHGLPHLPPAPQWPRGQPDAGGLPGPPSQLSIPTTALLLATVSSAAVPTLMEGVVLDGGFGGPGSRAGC
ncbi:hypothetical protein HaLaN_07951, partial [Haematococcus lacustris]